MIYTGVKIFLTVLINCKIRDISNYFPISNGLNVDLTYNVVCLAIDRLHS